MRKIFRLSTAGLAIPFIAAVPSQLIAQRTSADTAAKPTFETAKTPEECKKALYAGYGQTSGKSGADARRIYDDLKKGVGACALRIEKSVTSAAGLIALADLFSDAEMKDRVVPTYERAIAMGGPEQARAIGELITALFPYNETCTKESFATAEKWVAKLDALGSNALAEQISAHVTLADVYADEDSQMMTHAEKALSLARSIPAAEREKNKSTFIRGHVAAGNAHARKWDFQKAAALINEGLAAFPGDTSDPYTMNHAKRLAMVGKPAPGIEVEGWLNASGQTGRLDFSQAKVTVIEFTNPV
jgi:hypothetical protein